MRCRVYPGVVALALLGCSWARGAEVTIENPQTLPVNRGQVSLLYTMICQEVGDTYRIRDYQKLEYRLTLVLGEEHEHYVIDHPPGTATIYLQKWDETRFASAAAMLALHHLLSGEQFRDVVMKALKRYRIARPITVNEAKTLR